MLLEQAVFSGQDTGALDVLVNNAGVCEQLRPLAETDPSEWWRTWEINLHGVYLTTRAVLPHMLKQTSGGTIITISSVSSILTLPGLSAYNGSKTAVNRWVHLRLDLPADYLLQT